jgi:hypothetical protein
MLLTDHPLALGLAAVSGVPAAHPPEEFGRWLDHAEPDGVHLAVATALCGPVRRGEVARWAEELESLERRWFAPLVHALKRGRIGMVSTHLSSDTQLLNTETTRSDLRHFWRARRALARYRERA